jgi:hypothetical protein
MYYYPSVYWFYYKRIMVYWMERDKISIINHQKPKRDIMEDDALYRKKCYASVKIWHFCNPDIIWMLKQVNGILEIHKSRCQPYYRANYFDQ